MKRRDFFKLLGKTASAVGMASVVGLPKIEFDETDVIQSGFEPDLVFTAGPENAIYIGGDFATIYDDAGKIATWNGNTWKSVGSITGSIDITTEACKMSE